MANYDGRSLAQLRQAGSYIDPAMRGANDVSGQGIYDVMPDWMSFGGSPLGGLAEDYNSQLNSVSGGSTAGAARNFSEHLLQNGMKPMEAPGEGNSVWRWVEDARGNVVVEPQKVDQSDNTFGLASKLAAAAVTAGVAGAGFGVAGAPVAEAGGSGLLSGMDLAADAAIGSGNNITTAAGMLGGDAAAIGGGDALIDEIAAEAAGGAGDAVAGATGGTSAPGYSAAANYGTGMSGAQTGMFDSVLAATGSTTLASGASSLAGAASSAWDWLGSSSTVSAGGKLFGNTLATDILKLVGAGVMQASAEGATEDQREWIEEQQAARRRRQKPAKTPGMFTTATRGTNG